MSSEERAKIAANNRSLRVIKNELEALLERGFIDDDTFNNITDNLPPEASLRGGSQVRGGSQAPPANRNSAASPGPVTSGLAAMSMNDRSSASTPNHPPPSYSQSPAPPAPQHNEVAHAVALYRYNDPDSRDLNFEPGDHISVMEFLNNDWWLGKNIRTGEEGIFPVNYVRKENFPSTLAQPQPGPGSNNGYFGGDNKAGPQYGGAQYQHPQQYGGYPGQPAQSPAPGPSNPYNGPVPPMEMANQPGQQQQPGRASEMGKKFGKKLGNAAIFGAGATLGADLVNSIF